MADYPSPTSGVAVAARVTADVKTVTLSLGGTTTHQIAPLVKDVAGTVQTGTALVLTAAGTASAGVTVYTGTITGGAANAFLGFVFTIAGFATGANNGVFECTASDATTLTLTNAAGAAETHAGTATPDDAAAFKYISRNTAVCTVSAAGKITAVAAGGATVEVCHPTFNNTEGTNANGLYKDKIYAEIDVTVTP